jgi:hypothetical protein
MRLGEERERRNRKSTRTTAIVSREKAMISKAMWSSGEGMATTVWAAIGAAMRAVVGGFAGTEEGG